MNSNTHLYFNTGRAALKFILKCFSAFYKVKTKILMQSFNCQVVADAAIQAGADVYLCDIDLGFFSIDYERLKSINKNHFNVLLLTHYQGIPNFDYHKIIDYCKNNNVFVIEDMAQTYGSKIYGYSVGTKGDISFYSYAFDKPFSVYQGGSIQINYPYSEFSKFLIKEISKIPCESNSSAIRDLKMLKFLHKFSDEKYYMVCLNNYKIIYRLLKYNISDYKILLLMTYISKIPFFIKFINSFWRFFDKQIKISIVRMHNSKISEIRRQVYNFKCNSHKYYKDKIKKYGLKPVHHTSAVICWNRYSILDENNKLKNELVKSGIECGNFNWGTPLHRSFYGHNRVTCLSDLSNSEYASQNILNIPIWHLIQND